MEENPGPGFGVDDFYANTGRRDHNCYCCVHHGCFFSSIFGGYPVGFFPLHSGHRFTVAEKKEIADLIYIYKNMGFRTSENEITRISVNFVIEDYRENGENGVLHKIIQALNG